MSLVTLMDASLAYGDEKLFDHASLSIEQGERICLVGRNGTGKSTLLKVISGDRELDDGRLIIQNGLKIGRLIQDPPAYKTGTAYTLAASGIPVVGAALAEFAAAEDSKRQTELADFIERHDGWIKDGVVRKILNKIGLAPETPLIDLSGGWRRKAALASVLASEPSLLLLDEPTNHLDIETILWFEEWLKSFPGTIVFVTHDRSFADDCADRIVELDRGSLYSYPGSFSKYLELRAERFRMEDLANKEFDRILSEEEAWIRRGVKARLARNEGRVRNLEDLRRQRRERRSRTGQALFKANEAERTGNIVFEINDITERYQDQDIIRNFSATVCRGDRIGIVGPNGAGKTTLLNIILGNLKPTQGHVRTGMNVQVEYFDQYHEQLNLEQTVADNVADGHSEVFINGKSKHVISYLSNFLFTGRRARSPVKVLSGGEKNRLLLARLFAKPSNVLVMDEPTNDLDLETLDLLEDLVSTYPGTVIVISHDRHFIDKIATETWVFDGRGNIESIIGGWEDVLAYYRRIGLSDNSAQKESQEKSSDREEQKESRSARKSGLSVTEAHELEALPGKIEKLENEIAELEKQLSCPDIYKDGGAQARELGARLDSQRAELDKVYARWEDLESRSQEDK
ncbi:MAG: ATP-binding cassette domain-containing protein [Succinivibrio sp.]|nr:ATP-binding cassette domain-containing protein [Succinivibrio sp.]